jgi:fructokinase
MFCFTQSRAGHHGPNRIGQTRHAIMTARKRTCGIACIGEVLWDILPRGIFLGGAPLNVAYHLSRQGVAPRVISAVGRDFLGTEALRRIDDWGIDRAFIASIRGQATGTVRAVLDAQGRATYRIANHVAWDRIAAPPPGGRPAAPAAIVFGTLALRTRANRLTLTRWLETWPAACRVLDLNLRRPFDRGAVIKFALSRAQLVKLNDDELARMVARPALRTTGQLERAARRFADDHGLTRVCVTAGARGAGLLWAGRWYWEPGRKIEVRDTIGAGDAFLAALLAAIFGRNETPARALARACRLGEFVAARDGATPPYRRGEGEHDSVGKAAKRRLPA